VVAVQRHTFNLEYERIFAVCGKLRLLALWEFGRDGDVVSGSVSVERGADEAIIPVEWRFGEETPRVPYVGAQYGRS